MKTIQTSAKLFLAGCTNTLLFTSTLSYLISKMSFVGVVLELFSLRREGFTLAVDTNLHTNYPDLQPV